MIRLLLPALLWLLPLHLAAAQSPAYLYKTTTVRAAPGHLLALIDQLKSYQADRAAEGETPFFWMRHSQGDQWDLLLLFPLGTYGTAFPSVFDAAPDSLVAWQEDLFAYGPPLHATRAAFEGAGFFHVEMFQALPGRRAALVEERRMENAYLAALDRPQNLIFVRDQGAPWDTFTLGFYRDIKHFAESADIPLEDEDRAARAAGFESVYAISPYLRTLIREHHDTLAVAIR